MRSNTAATTRSQRARPKVKALEVVVEFGAHVATVILRCLFAMSAADASVQVVEDNEIRQITRELRIEHGDFVRARLEVREHLAVLRRTPPQG